MSFLVCVLSGLWIIWFCVLFGFSIICIVVIFIVFNVKYVSVLGPKLSPKIRAKNSLFLQLIGLELKPYRFTYLCLFVLKGSYYPIIYPTPLESRCIKSVWNWNLSQCLR